MHKMYCEAAHYVGGPAAEAPKDASGLHQGFAPEGSLTLTLSQQKWTLIISTHQASSNSMSDKLK